MSAPALAPERHLPSIDATGRQRYGLLLVAILASFFLQGLGPTGDWMEVVISLLLGVTLLLALWAGEVSPHLIRVAALIAGAAVVATAVQAASGTLSEGAVRLTDGLLVALAPPAIVLGVLRSLRAHRAVTVQAVFGVLCLYILLGMLFAFVFGVVDRFGGAPFFAGGQPATIARCLYFSLTTLTTVGYGDLTARTNLGHTLAVSEALLGQIYLVTVVSLIVGNLGRRRAASPE